MKKGFLLVAISLIFNINTAFSQTSTQPVVVDFRPIKDTVLNKANTMVAEIDLYLNPKAKNEGCNRSVLRSRSKVLTQITRLEIALADMPDQHYVVPTAGLVCETRSSNTTSKVRSAFTSLYNSVRSLVYLEKSCKAKYGLSYSPRSSDLAEVTAGLRRVPRKITSCY